MKNNRILTAILAALLLASTLASCSRRDQFRPDETDAPTGEQTTAAGQPDGSNPTETNPNGGEATEPNTTTPDIPVGDPSTGDAENGKITGNPYEGWTAEELYASFMEDQERSVYNNPNYVFGNTPYYVILDVQYGGSMFSKLTGQVVKICKDPLCNHEDCIFSNTTCYMQLCQVVDDRCYITVNDYKDGILTTRMYSFDLLMNDAKKVYEWSDTDSPKNVYVYKDKIYYSAEIKFDDGQYGQSTMVYDIKEKTTSPLREQPIRCTAIWFEGAYEWYTLREDGSLKRYNLDTTKDEEIISGTLLNLEEGEIGFFFMGSTDQTVYVKKSLVAGITGTFRYDMETGELYESIATCIYDDTYYQGVKHNVDSYKDDPHFEYYCNSTDSDTRYGGKYFRRNAGTGELEEVVSLKTDGIPDCVKDFFLLDGKYMMILYQTYKDFKNCYSPTLKEWDKSERYVVVNLETGTVYELGVDLSTQSYHNRPGRS